MENNALYEEEEGTMYSTGIAD